MSRRGAPESLSGPTDLGSSSLHGGHGCAGTGGYVTEILSRLWGGFDPRREGYPPKPAGPTWVSPPIATSARPPRARSIIVAAAPRGQLHERTKRSTTTFTFRKRHIHRSKSDENTTTPRFQSHQRRRNNEGIKNISSISREYARSARSSAARGSRHVPMAAASTLAATDPKATRSCCGLLSTRREPGSSPLGAVVTERRRHGARRPGRPERVAGRLTDGYRFSAPPKPKRKSTDEFPRRGRSYTA